MPILIPVAPRSTTANSYVTVAEADLYFDQTRLYTTAWDNAAATPDAEGYTVTLAGHGHQNENGEGDTEIVGNGTGTGSFTVGCRVSMASHDTIYTITAISFSGGLTHLTVSPALSQDLSDEEAITRLSGSQKEKALIQATSMLDEYFNWFGSILDEDQRLRWPRYSAYDRDGYVYDEEEIPEEIKNATCELALRLLQGDTLTEPSLVSQGFSRVTLGPISVAVETSNTEDIISDTVMSMVSHLGAPTALATRGSKVIPLWRV